MSTEITLPALGESVTEGTVSRWLKAVGERVSADEPVLEVSTDKVDTEIPAPASGVLLEIRVPEDGVAQVGQVLGVIGETVEASTPSEPAPSAGPSPAPSPEPVAAPSAPAPAPYAQPGPLAPAPAQPSAPSTEQAAPATATGTSAGATQITLPALGESVTEGTVSRWLKDVGEQVAIDEPVVEVSTDKVDTEIPAPAAGTLLEIRVHEDEVARVGEVLGLIGAADVTRAAVQQAPAAPTAPTPVAPTPTAAPPAPAPQAAPAPQVTGPAPGAQPAPVAGGQAPSAVSVARRAQLTANAETYVTPLVRRMAAERGVDLATVQGTGVGGRIRKQDILDAAAAQQAAQAAAQQAAAQQPTAAAPAPAAPTPATPPRGTTEKLSNLRKIVASRMVESLHTTAQLTATVEVDLSAIARLRAQVKDEFRRREGVGLTYLAFITKAVSEALKQFPQVNSSIDVEAGTVTYHATEDIGIAVDTPKGLMVPVIRNAGDLNVGGIARKIADLASRARDNKIVPDELAGATFTVTNYGSTGTLFDTPIINLPNVGILGTGALVKRPVVVTDAYGEDTIAIREMMYLSLTYDHRMVDGADASRFLGALKARLEAGDFGSEFGV